MIDASHNGADQQVDRRSACAPQGNPAESALLGGAAPTADADGIRPTERALRPLSGGGQRPPASGGSLDRLVGNSGGEQ